MIEDISKIKEINLFIKGSIESNCNDIIELNTPDKFIWYYAPARLVNVELTLKVINEFCLFSIGINDISISIEDPLIKLTNNGQEFLSNIDLNKNLVNFGYKISIKTFLCLSNIDLLAKFSFVFE